MTTFFEDRQSVEAHKSFWKIIIDILAKALEFLLSSFFFNSQRPLIVLCSADFVACEGIRFLSPTWR